MNPMGRLCGSGAVITYSYDGAGREAGRQYTNGTRVTWTYSAAGERTT